jgi:hypothetical protein
VSALDASDAKVQRNNGYAKQNRDFSDSKDNFVSVTLQISPEGTNRDMKQLCQHQNNLGVHIFKEFPIHYYKI